MAKLIRKGSAGLIWLAVAWLMTARPAAAQGDSLAPAPVFVNPDVAASLILRQTKPAYPALARLNFIQGRVRLQVLVTPEGRVAEAHVVRGHPFLAVSALNAVRHWLYRPLKTPSGPVEFLAVIDMNFSLQGRKMERFPLHAERDLNRQVRPPEILQKTAVHEPASWVRLRVLVSEEGRAIDSQAVAGSTLSPATRKHIEAWTFRPAHWGALAVPWYLDVEVPVEDPAAPRAAADPSGR